MAVFKNDQQLYFGRGPLDSNALVKTYSMLLDQSYWTKTNKDGKEVFVAYNGMIVGVWLNKDDISKNGIYFLFDPLVTTALKKPDVTQESNWHKFLELSDLTNLTEQLTSMSNELNGVKTKLALLDENQIVLRRDNEFNFRNTTPKANEICIVDVAGYGVRVKIGDGTTQFSELSYIDDYALKSVDSIIIKGFFHDGKFYSDASYSAELEAVSARVYIDCVTSKLYTYNGTVFEAYTTSLPNATAEVAGVVKLYNTIGQNTDGTMTQKAITDELDDKFEMIVDHDSETLVFDKDLY